jgi:hypothetical protein
MFTASPRSATKLSTKARGMIQGLRDAFWKNVKMPDSNRHFNQRLERT